MGRTRTASRTEESSARGWELSLLLDGDFEDDEIPLYRMKPDSWTFKAGDRVRWIDPPGHFASWDRLTVRDRHSWEDPPPPGFVYCQWFYDPFSVKELELIF